jgi:phage terminase large subunit-like protein
MISKLYDYISDIKKGKINVGLEILLAIRRFENDLMREDIYFDEEKANKAIMFISHLKHFTGKHDNKNFVLEPWQTFIIGNIFGWIYKQSGLRRYSNAYIEIARKNGKTALSAAISLYCLIAEGEANAEVILAANSREQARICFSAVSKFSTKLDPSTKYLKPYRSEVKFNNNIVKVVASDSSKLDGLNASCVILDEFHAAKTAQVYDVLKSSQVMREQPLFIVITTAGFDKKGPCYSLRITAKEVLEGLKTDDTTFIAIYAPDINDDWTDSTTWIKSNPNLDVTVKKSSIKDEVNKAKNNISLETGIKTKNLNTWCDTVTTWISDKYILQASKNISFDDISVDDTEIVVGVDLSATIDITAVSYMFLKDDKYNFIVKYYLPEESLNTATDKEYYKLQHSKGNLTLIPGNVVDYDYILKDILEIKEKYYISKIAYDTWNATQFAITATQNYLQLEPYSQTIGNFNRPTKEFERLMLQNKIVLDNNEVTRWMLSNVYLRTDINGNVKPDKSKREKKIDGVIAMLMCLGTYLNMPRYQVTII